MCLYLAGASSSTICSEGTVAAMVNEMQRRSGGMEGKKKRVSREEETLETVLAAAGVTLVVSCLKRLVQYFFRQWPSVFELAPSPLLFLLLHLVVASIVLISTHSHVVASRDDRRHNGHKKRSQARRKKTESCSASVREQQRNGVSGHGEELEDGDAAELNARVEAFITSFKQQLRVDSLSHRIPRTTEGA